MSASRYIIRSEESFKQTDNLNYITSKDIVNLPNPDDIPLLIKELYPYKDIIDYNSLLCFIVKTVKNERSMSYSTERITTSKCRSSGNHCQRLINPNQYRAETDALINIETKYTIVDKAASKYAIDTDALEIRGYADEMYSFPVCVLLFDKNNECQKLNISNKALGKLFNISDRCDTEFDARVYNLGRLIWYLDFGFQSKDNTIDGYAIEEKYIDFFSVNRPSINGINEYASCICDDWNCLYPSSVLPKHMKLWLNENIDYIRKDIGITEDEETPIQIKYVKQEEIENNSKRHEINTLLEQLRILGVDVDSIKM